MDKQKLINECKNMYLKLSQEKSHNRLLADQLSKKIFLYLLMYPDSDILVYQILSSFLMSVGRFDDIIETIKKNTIFELNNYYLVVLIAYIEDIIMGGIHDDTFAHIEKLNEKEKSRQAVIQILRAWYFYRQNNAEYVKALEKASKLDSTLPQPFFELANYFSSLGKIECGEKLMQDGLDRIKKILPDDERLLDKLDPDAFIDCFIKGYYVYRSWYKKTVRADEKLETGL